MIFDALPPSLFRDEAKRRRFADISIKDVLAMSALDAQVIPHEKSEFCSRSLAPFHGSAQSFHICP